MRKWEGAYSFQPPVRHALATDSAHARVRLLRMQQLWESSKKIFSTPRSTKGMTNYHLRQRRGVQKLHVNHFFPRQRTRLRRREFLRCHWQHQAEKKKCGVRAAACAETMRRLRLRCVISSPVYSSLLWNYCFVISFGSNSRLRRRGKRLHFIGCARCVNEVWKTFSSAQCSSPGNNRKSRCLQACNLCVKIFFSFLL